MKHRSLLLLSTLVLLLPGCIFVRHDHPRRALRAEPECRPNEYWDGDHCRHKGKGHGARKHDH